MRFVSGTSPRSTGSPSLRGTVVFPFSLISRLREPFLSVSFSFASVSLFSREQNSLASFFSAASPQRCSSHEDTSTTHTHRHRTRDTHTGRRDTCHKHTDTYFIIQYISSIFLRSKIRLFPFANLVFPYFMDIPRFHQRFFF